MKSMFVALVIFAVIALVGCSKPQEKVDDDSKYAWIEIDKRYSPPRNCIWCTEETMTYTEKWDTSLKGIQLYNKDKDEYIRQTK